MSSPLFMRSIYLKILEVENAFKRLMKKTFILATAGKTGNIKFSLSNVLGTTRWKYFG